MLYTFGREKYDYSILIYSFDHYQLQKQEFALEIINLITFSDFILRIYDSKAPYISINDNYVLSRYDVILKYVISDILHIPT